MQVTELLPAPIFYRSLVLHETVPDHLIVQTVDTVLAGARHADATTKKTAA